jgi:hypothetical protein
MTVCPHCHQRMLMRHGVRLPPRCADLFDMIENTGARGVLCETLAWVFYSDKTTRAAKELVAVHINHINDFLEPTDVQIRGGQWKPYRVVRRKQQRVAA